MDKFMYEILSNLKSRMCKPVDCYQGEKSGSEYSARQFYFKNLTDNLFEPMEEKALEEYENGSGNELNDKMKAIRSSSAMTYNIFRNEPTIFEGKKYDVSYEKQFFPLKRSVSSRPANLDAFLVSEDGENIIACEMKMMEWLCGNAQGIKSAYLDKENYSQEKGFDKFYDAIIRIIHKLACDLQYDAYQMFKHALALYNACASREINPKKLTLINCVWELPLACELQSESKNRYLKKLKREHDEYDLFYECAVPIKEAFFDLGIEFEIKYYNVGEFLSKMTLCDEVRAYLLRYTE